MRSSLAVLAALTVGTTIWALVADQPAVVPATTSTEARMSRPADASASASVLESAVPEYSQTATVDTVVPREIRAAARDILQPTTSPIAAAPATPVVALATFVPPVPVEPTVPQPEYRFQGRMRAPDGNRIVLLRRGQSVIQIHEGQLLDDGYQVLAIRTDSIGLRHPASGTEAVIFIPANPDAPGPW